MNRESTVAYLEFQRALEQTHPRLIELPQQSYDWTKLDCATKQIDAGHRPTSHSTCTPLNSIHENASNDNQAYNDARITAL
jgi:hypothetical protein